MNTSYKIVKAPNNKKLSRQLDKLAVFATRSVQIPKIRKRYRLGRKKYFADATLFHRLAVDFNLRKNVEVDMRKHQVVLAEGYYHRPILAEQVLFNEDEAFSKKAVLDAKYVLANDVVAKKHMMDMDTPKIGEIFGEKDLGVNDLFELDQYMDEIFEKTDKEIENSNGNNKKKLENVFVDKRGLPEEKGTDWWLEEDAFEIKKEENPFEVKK